VNVTFSFILRGLPCFAALSWAALAQATPRPLPLSYPYATLHAGETEIEQSADLVPVRVEREEDGGTRAVTSLRSELVTEFEYGVTDRLELGLYMEFRQSASAGTPALRFQGLKQRLRYRFAEEGEWPVDVGVYGEIAEFHNEFELEQKLLLSKRLGRVGLNVNLWVEQEYYFQLEEWRFIYNPTAAATFEITPSVIVGAEYWARGRFDEVTPATIDEDAGGYSPGGTRHYLGPTLMLQGSGNFVAFAPYFRLDSLGDRLEPGDPWGRVYFRVLIGLGLH
jgi:hypothetical protein